MTRLGDIARYVRSKNAGPFWITVDVFFRNDLDFQAYAGKVSDLKVAAMLNIAPETLRRYPVPQLHVLKFSFPRAAPQGGPHERDMHAGQVFVPLLDLDLDA